MNKISSITKEKVKRKEEGKERSGRMKEGWWRKGSREGRRQKG